MLAARVKSCAADHCLLSHGYRGYIMVQAPMEFPRLNRNNLNIDYSVDLDYRDDGRVVVIDLATPRGRRIRIKKVNLRPFDTFYALYLLGDPRKYYADPILHKNTEQEFTWEIGALHKDYTKYALGPSIYALMADSGLVGFSVDKAK